LIAILTWSSILSFAESISLAAGIVVGRLQYDKRLCFNVSHTYMKVGKTGQQMAKLGSEKKPMIVRVHSDLCPCDSGKKFKKCFGAEDGS
jgi:hypothetical protein